MITVSAIPVFEDNYVWLLTRTSGNRAAVVDPGAAGPVREALRAQDLQLTDVLLTHHHADHTGGVTELSTPRGPRILGPSGIDLVTRPIDHGDAVDVLGVPFRVLAVPGHTSDHVAFFGGGLLFAGDTLFTGGCGRVFEGTLEQMYASLGRLASLPPATRLYCGHEYTIANLTFALRVEPGNAALRERHSQAEAMRRRHLPTVPSTIGLERATNPFLRCEAPEIVASAVRHAGRPVAPGVETFAVIRSWKSSGR